MNTFILIALFVTGVYAITLLLFAIVWLSKSSFRSSVKKPSTAISIVIAARNEEKNIAACLQRISIQNYPAHLAEIIVVNDHSDDETVFEAEKGFVGCPFKHSILSLSEHDGQGKKTALSLGIKTGSGTLIITTDADCLPGNVDWLNTVVSFYESTKSALIISPVSIIHEPGFLSAFQEMELMGLGITTAGTALAGKAVMCNGANLAFEREAFFNVNGYQGNEAIASGDDVFLLNKMQHSFPRRVQYLKSKKALVVSTASGNFSAFVHQRLRWGGKFSSNRNGFNFFLGSTVLAENSLFVVFASLSCFFPQLAKYFALMVLTKWFIDFLLVFLAALFLKQTRVLWWYPLAMLINPLYICFTAVLSLMLKPRWKGRKI